MLCRRPLRQREGPRGVQIKTFDVTYFVHAYSEPCNTKKYYPKQRRAAALKTTIDFTSLTKYYCFF